MGKRRPSKGLVAEGSVFMAAWPKDRGVGRMVLTISLDTGAGGNKVDNSFDLSVPEAAYDLFKTGQRVKIMVIPEGDY